MQTALNSSNLPSVIYVFSIYARDLIAISQVQTWYNGYQWDVTLDNSDVSLSQLVQTAIDTLQERYNDLGVSFMAFLVCFLLFWS